MAPESATPGSASRWHAWRDRVRGSLFVVPMLFVIGGAVLGELMLSLDDSVTDVPARLTATVDSARAVLTVVASATLAFAGVAFSVALLLISQASSQYSPRVVHGLFRDPFTRRVMGVVIGTFTYCLVVLRAVRGPVDADGEAVVPSMSILVALVLGVVAILSTVAFISHTAHSMDVSQVLHRVTAEALAAVPGPAQVERAQEPTGFVAPADQPGEVVLDDDGWVQRIDVQRLLSELPEGTTVELVVAPGRFAVPGSLAARAWPRRDDDSVARAVRRSLQTGPSRTLLQDPSYGVRQLADVALRALSPGVHDPTTAHDAMLHLTAVLRALLLSPPPARVHRGEERVVVLAPSQTASELVDLAFDEVRVAAIGQPDVLVGLLEILDLLRASLPDGHGEARAALTRQAGLVLACAELGEVPEPDRDRVGSAYRARFAPD